MKGKYKDISFSYVYDQLTNILVYKGSQIKSVKEKRRLKLKNKEETASHSTMG